LRYFDNKVFVALARGTLNVYSRDHNGTGTTWNVSDPDEVQLGASVSRLATVGSNKLWCGCMNHIHILNTSTLEVEHSITLHQDPNKGVACLAASGFGVWVALNGASSVRLYHATTHELLSEVNAGPAVAKMLSSSDDIIRQHKAACLRVTSLLCCKDLLWVGTSAGVVLVVPLPHMTATTVKLQQALNITASPMKFVVPSRSFKGGNSSATSFSGGGGSNTAPSGAGKDQQYHLRHHHHHHHYYGAPTAGPGGPLASSTSDASGGASPGEPWGRPRRVNHGLVRYD
ncbi:unnamed protein product, partial [Notodromas monacha]